jgi:hypothetical protein
MTRATRARTDVLGSFSSRTAAVPPGTGTSEDLFSITGKILVTGFYGYVSVAVPAASIDFDIALDPDDGGADVALATLVAMDSAVAGSWVTLNPTAGGALVLTTDVAYNLALATPIACDTGDIKLNVAGGGAIGATCRVSWGLLWLPLTADGAVAVV